MGLSDSLRGLASAGAGAGTVIKPAVGATAVAGIAAPYAAVPVYKGTSTTPIGTAFADAAGNWSLTLGTAAVLGDVYRTPSSGAIVGVVLNALTVSTSAATVGVAFTATIGGLTPGSTPSLTGAGAAGLSVSGATISGTPTTAGAVNIVETNANGTNSPRTTSALITVAAAPVGPTPLSISGANGTATVGDTTSFTPTISGGTAPYTVSATGLPPGRSIANAATGLTTGAYTTAGSYSAVYTVTDSVGATASLTRSVTVSAASGAITGIVGNRSGIAARNTITPQAGAINGETLTQFTLTSPARYLKIGWQNVNSLAAALITTGIPTLTMRAGIRLRSVGQSAQVPVEVIVAGWVEDVSTGTTGATRDVVMASGQHGFLHFDLGQVYPAGVSCLLQMSGRYASLPDRYPEADIGARAFNEVNGFGSTLRDITLNSTSPWDGVGKLTSYQIFVPRSIQGLNLASRPPSFLALTDSIGAGSGDTGGYTTVGMGHVGLIQRGFANDYGLSVAGATGLSLASVANDPVALAARLTDLFNRGFTYVVLQVVANDWPSNRTVFQVLADIDKVVAAADPFGIRVIPCTSMPRPSTSNASQSINALDVNYKANATEPSNNGGAKQNIEVWQAVNNFNAAIRTDKAGRPAGSGRLGWGFLDPHASVADPADPTRFRTDSGFTFSGDGIHPPTAYHTQAAADIKAKLPSILAYT